MCSGMHALDNMSELVGGSVAVVNILKPVATDKWFKEYDNMHFYMCSHTHTHSHMHTQIRSRTPSLLR